MTRRGVPSLGLIACLLLSPTSSGENAPTSVRAIVRVAPRDIGRRDHDEMPAEFRLLASAFDSQRRVDASSLEVVRGDAENSRPLSQPMPLRWYDDAIP